METNGKLWKPLGTIPASPRQDLLDELETVVEGVQDRLASLEDGANGSSPGAQIGRVCSKCP